MHLSRLATRFAVLPKFLVWFGISVWLFGNFSPLFAETVIDISARVQKLEDRLSQLENQQTQIVNQQQEILNKLDTVKIWAHR